MLKGVAQSNDIKNLKSVYEAMVIRRVFIISDIDAVGTNNLLDNEETWQSTEGIVRYALALRTRALDDRNIVCNHVIDQANDRESIDRIIDMLSHANHTVGSTNNFMQYFASLMKIGV